MKVLKGWLIECINAGSDEYEEVEKWLEKNPNYTIWDSEFFKNEIISTGHFVAESDENMSGEAPMSSLLFSNKEVAETYCSREPTYGAGLSELKEVLYFEINSEEIDVWEINAEYILGDNNIVVFLDSESANKALNKLI
jgi:hypothetical protein